MHPVKADTRRFPVGRTDRPTAFLGENRTDRIICDAGRFLCVFPGI